MGMAAVMILAVSPQVAAQRDLALAVAAIQAYAEQRNMTRFCLAHGSADPDASLLAALREQHLEATAESACVGDRATGMLVTYTTKSEKKGLSSVNVDAAS